MRWYTRSNKVFDAIEPTDIVPDPLTHILYSFADISPDTGAISLTDSYADEQVYYFFRIIVLRVLAKVDPV